MNPLIHKLYEKLIVLILLIEVLAGFSTLTIALMVKEAISKPSNDNWYPYLFFGIFMIVCNAVTAAGFVFLWRAPRHWRGCGLSRGTWLFLFCVAYSLGLGCVVAIFM